MIKLAAVILATAAVLPLAALAATPPPPAPVADGSLGLTFVCHATDPNAKGDDAKGVDLTIGLFKTAPLSATLMFGQGKGDKAQSVEWMPAKDGGVFLLGYELQTYKLKALVAVPSGQFSYLMSNSASQHFSQFGGRCSLIAPDGTLLN
jgi:hypothetical protein